MVTNTAVNLVAARSDAERSLGPPAVSPGVYDEHYYRSGCIGSRQWEQSQGSEMSGFYAGCLERARFEPGGAIVDVGTGRGELLAAAIERGARRAIGVDYSPDGVQLASETLAARGIDDRAEVLLADARRLPVEDGTADLVTMLDVVEHLSAAELDATLVETLRVLAPNGSLFIHTLPSRTVYDVTYRFQRALVPGRRRRWPADPRNDYERQMHVGEQTLGSLRRALRRAGFDAVDVRPGEWVHADFVPDERARKLYWRLAKRRPTARFGVADIWGRARKADRA